MSTELPDDLGRVRGPRAADHALHLYARPLHPELVPLARVRKFEAPTLRARVGLLREMGHLVELNVLPPPNARPSPDLRAVIEVVAPVGLDLPPAGRIDLRRVGASATGSIDEDDEMAYVCSWSYEQKPEPEFALVHARILASPPRGERLLVNRGHPENEGPSPFSLLDVIADLEASRLETFVVHAFPADRAFFFVQSVVRARQG